MLQEAERRGPPTRHAAGSPAALLGEVLYELNDAAGALELIEPRLEVMERVSIPDMRARSALVLARSRWMVGRPLDAIDYLEQSQDHAERMGLDRMLAYVLLEHLQFRLRQGELLLAAGMMASLDALDARHGDVETGRWPDLVAAAARAYRLLLHGGDLERALPRLEALAELCRRRGRGRRIPYLGLQSAAALRRLGRPDAASVHVRTALRAGHRLGLVRTLLDAHEDVPALLREA